MSTTFTVKLNVRDRGNYLSANCADVPGLHVAGKNVEAVRSSAMKAVKDLYKRNLGKDVDVYPTDDLTELRVRLA